MKILVATPLLAPDIGGPATYCKVLLSELPKRGIEVSIAYFGEVRHRRKILRHLSFFFLVLKRARGVEVVYALDPVSVGFPARVAAFLMGKKFMVRIAGDYAWEQGVQRFGVSENLDDFSKRSGYGPIVSLFKFLEFVVASTALRVIVPSNYFKGIILNWGVPEKKITVIYSVFEFNPAIPDKQACRDALGIHGVIFLSSGRLVPWKGFPLMIELMSELKNRYLEATLYIAGHGPERERLEAHVRRYALENHVVFLGQLRKEKLSEYVRASDIFLLNSGYEGFSHQLLEVMATGTPIITTPVGGNVELLKDEVSGLFAPYNDKEAWLSRIDAIMNNTIDGNALAERAKSKVSEFTVERMIEGLVPVLRNLK